MPEPRRVLTRLLAALALAGSAPLMLGANDAGPMGPAKAALLRGDGIAGEVALNKLLATGISRQDVAARMGEALILQGRVQFLLCHGHEAVPSRLDDTQYAFARVSADILLPVTAPNRHGQAQHWIDDRPQTPVPVLTSASKTLTSAAKPVLRLSRRAKATMPKNTRRHSWVFFRAKSLRSPSC